MSRFQKIIYRSSQELSRGAEWATAAMMGLVVVNVVLRYLRHPIIGMTDFVAYLSALIVVLAMAYCAVQKGHISISFLMDRLPQRTQIIIDIIIGIISIAFLWVLAWRLTIYATSMLASGQLSMDARIPVYPIVYLIGFGFAVLGLVVVADLVRLIARAVKK